MDEVKEKLVEFVYKVATAPEGPYSRDSAEYYRNVIENTMREAEELLKELDLWVEGEE